MVSMIEFPSVRLSKPVSPNPTSETKGKAMATAPAPVVSPEGLTIEHVSAWFGAKQAIRDINLHIKPRQVTAIIGPSGCGKSTFIRCLNRMHEVVPGARMEGRVLFKGQDLYVPEVDPTEARHRIGMSQVFSRSRVSP